MADKKKALETALAQIEKAYGKGWRRRYCRNRTFGTDALPCTS